MVKDCPDPRQIMSVSEEVVVKSTGKLSLGDGQSMCLNC